MCRKKERKQKWNYHALCFLYFRICFQMKFLFELLRGTCCAPSDLLCVTKELPPEYILMGNGKWRFAITNPKLRRELSEKQNQKKEDLFSSASAAFISRTDSRHLSVPLQIQVFFPLCNYNHYNGALQHSF